MAEDQVNSEGAPLQENGLPKAAQEIKFEGKVQTERRCTDIYCAFVFLFFFLCLWCIGGWSYQEGWPGRLLRGWDVYGNVCGYGEFVPKEYTYFATPLDDIDVQFCLTGCPAFEATESICPYGVDGFPLDSTGCFDAYPSKPFFNKYCLPSDYHQRKEVLIYLYSQDKVMSRVVGDLSRAWDILAVMLTITGVSVLVYVLVLKIPGKGHKIANFLFYAVNLPFLLFLFAVMTYLLYEEKSRVKGKLCDDFGPVHMQDCAEGDTADGYEYLAWTSASIFFVILCSLPYLIIKKLKPGVKTLGATAGIYANDIGVLLCFFIMVVVGVGFYAYFITLIIYTVATGEHDTHDDVPMLPQGSAEVWDFYTAPRVLIFFDVFMILWHFSFFAHILEFVAASAGSYWMLESNEKRVFPLFKAVFRALRYHIGSIFLASIIVPCWRFPRDSILGKSLNYSEALAYQACTGEPFFVAAKHSTELIKEFDASKKPRERLNNGNSIIWVYQITIMLIAPVLTAHWILHKNFSFQEMSTKEISSVIAMDIYALFFSWYLSMLFGCMFKGLMHGGVIAALLDEKYHGEGHRQSPPEFLAFMDGKDDYDPVNTEEENQPRPAWGSGSPAESEARRPAPEVPPPALVPQRDSQSDMEILVPEDELHDRPVHVPEAERLPVIGGDVASVGVTSDRL